MSIAFHFSFGGGKLTPKYSANKNSKSYCSMMWLVEFFNYKESMIQSQIKILKGIGVFDVIF
jgi:hypothetical protein